MKYGKQHEMRNTWRDISFLRDSGLIDIVQNMSESEIVLEYDGYLYVFWVK